MRPSVTLARRAVGGLAIASIGAGTAFLLSYFRTLRKIVEEPDIIPGSGGIHWLPRFGNSVTTAIVHFSIRTLLRSRQHRVILAFYLGVGFAIVILFMQAPAPRQQSSSATGARRLLASVLMLCCSVAGTRVVFAMPLQLKANWIFRITPLPGPREVVTCDPAIPSGTLRGPGVGGLRDVPVLGVALAHRRRPPARPRSSGNDASRRVSERVPEDPLHMFLSCPENRRLIWAF